MIFPEADILENWGTDAGPSRYGLVALAAKRAKQIKAGAPPLIKTESKNPLTIALEEIASGVINTKISDNDLPKVELDSRVSLISSFSFGDDSDDLLTLSGSDDEWDEFEEDDLDDIDEDETSDEELDTDAILAEDIIPVKKNDDDVNEDQDEDEDEEIKIKGIDVDSDEISIEEIDEELEDEDEEE